MLEVHAEGIAKALYDAAVLRIEAPVCAADHNRLGLADFINEPVWLEVRKTFAAFGQRPPDWDTARLRWALIGSAEAIYQFDARRYAPA